MPKRIQAAFLFAAGLLAACLPASAQCTPATINAGQTLTGTLSSTCTSTRRTGSYARLYTFQAIPNYAVTVTIDSSAFDAYGYLISAAGSVVASDDETGGNHNALIRYTTAAAGIYTVEVTSAAPGSGNFTISLAITTAGVPVISSNGVVNGGSYLAGIASGSWITIKGTNLSTTARIWSQSDFKGSALPLSLDGVSVKVNNKDAPVYYISPTQINALAPSDTTLGAVPVTVTNARGASVPVNANLQPVAPAWLAFSQAGGLYPAAVHADGSYVGPATLFGSAATAVPAMPNETILLYGTGFGRTSPAADPLVAVTGALPLASPNDLLITVGGSSAKVAFAGLTGSGLYQFNVVVPNLPDGEHNLIATIGGSQTQTLKLAVKTPPPAPTITAVSPTDLVWGQIANMTLTGTAMAGVNKVEFSDTAGIRMVGNLSTSSTSATFTIVVDGTAATGEHTVTAISPSGRSGALPFTVRKGSPAITRVSPATVYPDRFYATGNLYSAPMDTFSIQGTDLAGVDNIEVSPQTPLTFGWSSRATSLTGMMAVAADAAPGPRQLTVSSPGGRSNTLTFTIQSPAATAPVITGVTLGTPVIPAYSASIKYTAKIQFTDQDGDFRMAAKCPTSFFLAFTAPTGCPFVRFSAFAGGAIASFDVAGPFLDLAGQTSGTIDLSSTIGTLSYGKLGAAKVAVTLYDAGGHSSNSVIVDVPSWMVPAL